MERAVINAGPLVALSLIERLPILTSLIGEFWIPDVVYAEVTVAGYGRPGAEPLSAPEWSRRVCSTPEPDPLLVAELDPGEAAVIALARSLTPCTAILDERRGRRIAQHVYGLPVKGTAGLLVEAKRRGLVDDLRTVLLALKTAGYYLSDRVIDAACRAADDAEG